MEDSRQKEIFENIHNEYYESTTDRYATAYKERYVMHEIEKYLGNSTSLMELACGRGEASGWLRARHPSLQVSGCDISEPAAIDYTKIHGRPCYVADLTKAFDHHETYDALVVMGGIHHLVDNLNVAFKNISSLLRPCGRLIMVEPNADYFLNPIRRLWYRLDKNNFDAYTEEALSQTKLLKEHGDDFRSIGVKYFGGPAYFLLMLNMFLRVPNNTKRIAAPFLMGAERMFNVLPGKLPYASFIACWEKV